MGSARLVSLAVLLALGPCRAGTEERRFVVDREASSLTISVGKSGLFSFAGHEHEVVASGMEGTIVADALDLPRSSVSLRFGAAGLRVSGKGEPAQDVPKVQAKMEGPEVLDVPRFPEITFRSTIIEGRQAADGTWNLRVTGDLAIRGATKQLTLPLRAQLEGARLTASGQAVIRQSDFGIKPVSVAGVVKVKNELGVDYKIVAKAEP